MNEIAAAHTEALRLAVEKAIQGEFQSHEVRARIANISIAGLTVAFRLLARQMIEDSLLSRSTFHAYARQYRENMMRAPEDPAEPINPDREHICDNVDFLLFGREDDEPPTPTLTVIEGGKKTP